MLEANREEKITIHTMAEVDAISGFIGNFDVRVKKHPRYVIADKCNGCGLCAQVCPVVVPNPFDEYLSARRVADHSFAQAVPNTFDIINEACIHCYECVAACDQFAIDFSQQEELVDYKVGTIIVATGWDLYKPPVTGMSGRYGYGRYENVIDQVELERILAPNGPTVGHLTRPSDHKVPRRIVMIQCVGSRGEDNPHCSDVCCALAVKNAKLIKSEYPTAEIIISYIDIRTPGKDFEEYYARARESGIIFLSGKVGEIKEDPVTKNIAVIMEDKNSGEVFEVDADLVVLSSASIASEGTDQIARVLKLEQNAQGFIKEFHSRLNPIDSKMAGVFIAGSCQGQKSIGPAVSSARGAASASSLLVNNEKYEIELIRAVVDEQDNCSKCYRCIETCPYSALSSITISGQHKIVVDTVACKGCGSCTNACRSQTIQLRYFRDIQYEAYVDALFSEASK